MHRPPHAPAAACPAAHAARGPRRHAAIDAPPGARSVRLRGRASRTQTPAVRAAAATCPCIGSSRFLRVHALYPPHLLPSVSTPRGVRGGAHARVRMPPSPALSLWIFAFSPFGAAWSPLFRNPFATVRDHDIHLHSPHPIFCIPFGSHLPIALYAAHIPRSPLDRLHRPAV